MADNRTHRSLVGLVAAAFDSIVDAAHIAPDILEPADIEPLADQPLGSLVADDSRVVDNCWDKVDLGVRMLEKPELDKERKSESGCWSRSAMAVVVRVCKGLIM